MSPTPFHTTYCSPFTHPQHDGSEKTVPTYTGTTFSGPDARFFSAAELLSISISNLTSVKSATKHLPLCPKTPSESNSTSESDNPPAPARVAAREVYIPARDEHDGIIGVFVTVEWICPVCGGPRGEIVPSRSYDGSRILYCDGWSNPCGHIDKYDDVRAEAVGNG